MLENFQLCCDYQGRAALDANQQMAIRRPIVQ